MEDCSDLFAMAVRHHQAGQLAEATSLYGEILKLEPGHTQARHLLGLLSQQKVATHTDPKLAETHFDLGQKCARSGEHQKAIEELRKAIQRLPTQATYRYELGLSLQALRQLDAAVAVYRGCLDIDPAMADAWSSLGIVLSELGKVEEAISCLLRVLELKPTYADGYFNVGVCFASIWEHAKAVEYLRKAIALRPAMAAAHLWLGKSLYVMGDIRGAINSYRTSLRYEPGAAETHWALSLAHLMLGEHTKGLEGVRVAMEMDKISIDQAQFFAAAVERKSPEGAYHSAPSRAGIWRYLAVCALRPTRCRGRRTGNSGGALRPCTLYCRGIPELRSVCGREMQSLSSSFTAP